MKTLRLMLTIAVFLALSPVLSGSVTAQPPIIAAGGVCLASPHPFMLAQTDYGGDFDLNYCQWECRMRYGLEPTGGGIYSDTEDRNRAYELQQGAPTYLPYAAYIADCQRKFWSEFDKKTGEIGKKTR